MPDTNERIPSEPQSRIPVRLIQICVVLASGLTLLFPTPEGMTAPAHRLIAVTVLMAGFWMFQVLPMAVTSLFPLALYPLLAIQSPAAVSKSYVNDTLFLYLGGMIIALGIERWDLHRRIALTLVGIVGASPRQLVLGFMLTTAVLSMWISNTACTLMMLPIAVALLKVMEQTTADAALTGSTPSVQRNASALAVAVLLGIAYGASIGGMTTLVGTPTNNAAVGIYRATAGAAEITVAKWLMACAPIGAFYLAIVWFVLTRSLPKASPEDRLLTAELRRRKTVLGRASPAERRMFGMFVVTAVLWICRRPVQLGSVTVLPGWQDAWGALFDNLSRLWNTTASSFPDGPSISDATVAVLMAILLFLIPSGERDRNGRSVPLMDWATAVRLPWDIILLFGGGFAIAGAFSTTGLSDWLGMALREPLGGQPVWLVIAILCALMTFLTELTSNVATVSTLTPTILALAVALEIDPRLLFIPATLAASCAFMLPIATPPNAIVFGSGRVPIRQMARYGLLLNLIGVPILTFGTLFIIRFVLDIP
jgi:solute carrier family 13 (sodium-dependent dicarboxylate transporter), member 2/3/5